MTIGSEPRLDFITDGILITQPPVSSASGYECGENAFGRTHVSISYDHRQAGRFVRVDKLPADFAEILGWVKRVQLPRAIPGRTANCRNEIDFTKYRWTKNECAISPHTRKTTVLRFNRPIDDLAQSRLWKPVVSSAVPIESN